MDLARRLAELVGAARVHEVPGGHQSRVFEAVRRADGERMVVKVLDGSRVHRATVETRVQVVVELAELDEHVCRPLAVDGRLVTAIDGDGADVGLVTCYEYAPGAPPVAADPGDARLMGRTLALLHASMRRIGAKDLPLVAALRAAPLPGAGPVQLLHGDFNAGNLCHLDGEVRVFDFDDCGYGPPVFDVANALYMVLFDEMTDVATTDYRSFGDAFVSGYSEVSGGILGRDEVNACIDLRVAALGAWLDDLETAPVGIRAATPAWHASLRSFVATYHARRARTAPLPRKRGSG